MLRRGALQLGRRQIGLSNQSASAVSNHLIHQSKPATASTVFRAWFSSYPHHEVVGLPALSPVRLALGLNSSCCLLLLFPLFGFERRERNSRVGGLSKLNNCLIYFSSSILVTI